MTIANVDMLYCAVACAFLPGGHDDGDVNHLRGDDCLLPATDGHSTEFRPVVVAQVRLRVVVRLRDVARLNSRLLS